MISILEGDMREGMWHELKGWWSENNQNTLFECIKFSKQLKTKQKYKEI